ncbi:MAG: MFS transporter [Candidatus Pacebacteria bacterium]|nr:MFS transporter [Candidatus Paceibacterota bacterium]
MLYGIRVLRELTNNLVFFFLPLFLFQTGPKLAFFSQFDLSDFQKGMILVGMHYVLYRLAMGLSVLPVGKLIVRVIGFKNAFIISRLLAVLVFLLLKESTLVYPLVFLAALVDGIEGSFFWPNFYSIFGSNAKEKRVGEDLGLLQFLLQFVAMAAPAVGGLITLVLGFEMLFLFGVVLSMLGVTFAVAMHPEKMRVEPKFWEFWSWLKESRFRRLALSYVGNYTQQSVLALWPLYVFLIVEGVEKVGYLYSFSLFISMILSFFIGFYIDHNKSKKPFMVSGGLLSLLWFVRMQVIDIWGIAFVDITNRLIGSFHWLFYDSILIKRGSGKSVFPFFVYREIIISAGGILSWLTFIVIFIVSGDWKILFLIAAVGTMSSLVISDKIKQK